MTTVTPTQSTGGRSLRSGIESGLIQLLASPINPDRSNSGKQLWEVYFWQVVADLADARYKAGWELLQKAGGLVDSDEGLRDLTTGEHIAAESNKFSVLVTVSKPRRKFDREKFAKDAARKFEVSIEKVEALIEKCIIPGNPALTKRIIEIDS
jgi:hypothetical protein